MVEALGKQADIDLSYYDALVTAAVYGSGKGKDRKPGIADFGDFEQFVSDGPILPDFPLDDDDLPWYIDNKDYDEAFKKR
jgi:hypothetical protein